MRNKICLIILSIILLLCVFCASSFATENIDLTVTDEVTDNGDIQNNIDGEYEVVYNDIFKLENDDYEMNELVDGNAYIVANGDVKISREINGTAYIISNGTVEIEENAIVYDSVFVVAKKVILKGFVYDVYSMSNSFEMTDTAYVRRDINVMANNLKLRGTIDRNANISGNNIDVSDDESTLLIGRNFNYTAPNKIEDLEKIVTNGEINFTQEVNEVKITVLDEIKMFAVNAVASMIYLLVIYFTFKYVSPKFIQRAANDFKEKSIVNFAVGLLSYVMIAIAAILTIILLITEVGMPIAVFAWIIIILGIFISSAIFEICIFEIISQKYEKIKENIGFTILTLIGISLCISLLGIIPYVGTIVKFIVFTMGVGLVIRNIIAKKETVEENK